MFKPQSIPEALSRLLVLTKIQSRVRSLRVDSILILIKSLALLKTLLVLKQQGM